MKSVGSYEAKTHLPSLLSQVEQGESIIITKRGKVIAKLIPAFDTEQRDVKQVIDEFRAYSQRQARTLGTMTIRDMIEEGRR
jgi:prevent-host-death family protein